MAARTRIAKTPYEGDLSSPNITVLTQSITEQNRIDLFRYIAMRLDNNEPCAVDSTSRSSWKNCLSDIRYGKSKDKLPISQTVEAVVYTLNGHMPVYYRTFPGNTPNSRSLSAILADLKNVRIKDIVMITDRGYESIRNLEMYIDEGQSMIMGTRTDQKYVRKEIDKLGSFDHHPEGIVIKASERIYFKQYELEFQIEGKRDNVKQGDHLRLILYFDPVRRSHEMIDLDIALTEQKKSTAGKPAGRDSPG